MCAPRGPPTSLSQLQLSTEALLRKCKEFSKIVTATSQSLWTLVSCILSCSFTDDQVSLWLNLCQGTRTTDWLLKLLKSQMHTVGKEWWGGTPQACPWQTSIINHRTLISVQDPSSKFGRLLKTTITFKSQGTTQSYHSDWEQALSIKENKRPERRLDLPAFN